MDDTDTAAPAAPQLDRIKTSLRDAYMAELLGDVGKVLDGVSALQAALPSLERQLNGISHKAAEKLSAAEDEAAKRVLAAGRAAGAEAVKTAANEQIKALVGDVRLAVDHLRGTADQASGSLRAAVAQISIWRQVGFCALSGAVSALLICLMFWTLGAGPAHLPGTTIVSCPAALGHDDCLTFQLGTAMQKMWPYLPPSERKYLTELDEKVER